MLAIFCALAVLYFYISWYSASDTAIWFRNNIGRNCQDTARADYSTYCQDIRFLCTTFRNITEDANATVIAEADRVLSAEAGIPVSATCESFTGEEFVFHWWTSLASCHPLVLAARGSSAARYYLISVILPPQLTSSRQRRPAIGCAATSTRRRSGETFDAESHSVDVSAVTNTPVLRLSGSDIEL